MPKKRNHNFKQLQGSSSSTSSAGRSNGETNTLSVNERLGELRKLEARDAAAKKRELADSVNRRSVPPQVQGLLGVPAFAPPKPKAAVRTRERLRTPGPAPPQSWLESGATWSSALALRVAKRRGSRTGANTATRNRPNELMRFARLTGFEHVSEEDLSLKLMHIVLKRTAESWDLFVEDDYPALLEIPQRLRLRLIAYIGVYSPVVNAGAIQTLLQGTEIVDHLNLGGLVGHGNITLKKITKALSRSDKDEIQASTQAVIESWDAEETVIPSTPSLTSNRASHLTRLCLSHPGPAITWRDLLAFSKTVPQVTHLSLAYWPWPTLTPNLSTATVSSPRGPDVRASGSYYYSALDQDFEEPAIVLRQLSGNLLCLQWLDVEGCQAWSPALGELGKISVQADTGLLRRRTDWLIADSKETPVLASNWKNLVYINLAQGWLPNYWGIRSVLGSRAQTMTAMESLVARSVVDYLEAGLPKFVIPPADFTLDMLDAQKKRAWMWLQAEVRMHQAAIDMKVSRRNHACKRIHFDFGAAHGPAELLP